MHSPADRSELGRLTSHPLLRIRDEAVMYVVSYMTLFATQQASFQLTVQSSQILSTRTNDGEEARSRRCYLLAVSVVSFLILELVEIFQVKRRVSTHSYL